MSTVMDQPQASSRTPLGLLNAVIWWIASRFGDKAKEVDRFLKFAAVGAFGAVVDFATLNILQNTTLVPEGQNVDAKVALATGIAFTVAVISNYIWNRYWTFPDSRSRSAGTQFVQFFIISIVGLVFRLFFVGFSYEFFGNMAAPVIGSNLDTTAIAQLGSNIAQAISIGIVMFWNFFANRLWTYNDID